MIFPGLVYRCPGPHFGPPGTTYVAKGVADDAELSEALAAGWFATLPEAAETFLAPPATSVEEKVIPSDDAPPTREELEAKATELGIKVDKRWSDKTLGEKIAAALEG